MKVSIIVPVYNVGQYLGRGLDSLINQTLQDIEIICVDDKSTDGSLSILDKYAAKDKRIKLIKLARNQGVAVARNHGMAAARGEYMGFMDPDDYVDLDFYEKLHAVAQTTNAEIVRGDVITTDTNTDGVSANRTDIRKIKRHRSYFSRNFWSAIYRRDFLKKNKIEFPAGIITAQDCVFLTHAILSANDIRLVTDTYYHYLYQRTDSLNSVFLSSAKAQSKYNAFKISFDAISAAKLSDADFAKFVGLHVLAHINYELNKKFDLDEDRRRLFDLALSIYKMGKIPNRIFAKRFRHDTFLAIKCGSYDHFKMNINSTRLYLFGFIPMIKIIKHENYIFIKLFDVIPLAKVQIKVSGFKIYLFNLVPILKIKGL